MKDILDLITLILQTYPYIMYILLFLSIGWLIYTIVYAISQMDFGHSITDLYDKSGRIKTAKKIRVRFIPPIISVLVLVMLVMLILN